MTQPIAREHGDYILQRGKTWSGGTTTIAAADYGDSVNREGHCVPIRDQTALGGVWGTGKKAVLARNVSEAAVAGGTRIAWASGYDYKRFDTTGTAGYVDPLIPGSVAIGDLCWVVLD